MTVQTDLGKTETLTSLLNEARAEADALRAKLQVYEKTFMSSRLIMGHELKRPATAICGYLELALEEIESADKGTVKETLEKAQKECALLNEVNSLFLDLLKIDDYPVAPEGQFIVIRDCVKEVIGHLSPDLRAKERIDVHIAPNADTVSFNLNALKVVLMNVIENALVYSDGDAPVNVAVEKMPDKRGLGESNLLRIRVTDQGKGIPDKFLRQIFKPFVRLNGRQGRGAGLGLTLVRSLVELHGGSVYVRSIEGEGTTIHITVPEIPARNGGAIVT